MKKTMLAAAALTLVLPMPVLADPPPWAPAHGYYKKHRDHGERIGPRTRVWRGDDGRYYCRRSNGTTGLIIGAAGGALIGRAIARDRTAGAIIGAAGGGLLGRAIDRDRYRCR